MARVWRSVAWLRQPRGRGIAIDLQPGYAQPCDAVRLDRPLPGEKFFNRQLVASASFLEADGTAAHGVDNHGLAPRDPAFGVRGRQLGGRGADARQDLV